MKSYFCQKCGREYRFSECLRNGYSMFCFDCPNQRVRISGFPYILIGVFLGLMFFIYRKISLDTSGAQYLFLPASIGMLVIGVVRVFQQHRLWKKTLVARKALDEKKKRERQHERN